MTILRPEFITVVQGEDRTIALRITNADGTPFTLTGIIEIKAKFRKADNSLMILTQTLSNGVKAKKVYAAVTYTAAGFGVIGNSIVLTFTGANSITTAISTWNGLNPGNQVTSNATNSATIPAAGTVQLEGGVDAYSSVSIIDANAGRLAITIKDNETQALRLGDRQNFTVEITTASSIRIANFPRALSIVAQSV